MGYLNSGNSIVDAMGSINISGNIIPAIWYKTITKENGKPYLLAIAILSDIVYWYRPTEVRDPQTGHITSWKKKFSDDLLRQSYQYYAELLGESKKTVKVAMDRLEALNVIRREFRTIICGDGIVCNNVMYIALNPDVLYCLTFPEKIIGVDEDEDYYSTMPERKEESLTEKLDSSMEHPEGNLPAKWDTPMEKLGGSLPQKWDTPMEKLGGSLPQKWDRPIEKAGRSLPQKWDRPIEKAGGSLPTKMDRPIDKVGDRYLPNRIQVHTKKDTGLSENGGTNTYTSAKISNIESHLIHPSSRKSQKAMDEMEDFNQYVEIIKKNIDYTNLIYLGFCATIMYSRLTFLAI